MNNKLKMYMLKELNKTEKHILEAYYFLREIVEDKPDDYMNLINKAIYNLCEVDESNSNIIVTLEEEEYE